MKQLVFVILAPLDLHYPVQQIHELEHSVLLHKCVDPLHRLIAEQLAKLVELADFNGLHLLRRPHV